MFSKEAMKLTRLCHEAIWKISKGKWEWEPEKWQRVIYRGKVCLVLHVITPIYVDLLSKCGVFIKDLTPLLHWEDDIEPILVGLGYYMRFTNDVWANYGVLITSGNQEIDKAILARGETRQEVVMRAVIQLAKEN